MAKSKYAPALFELIDSGSQKKTSKLAVPKWFKRRRSGQAPATTDPPMDSESVDKPTNSSPRVQAEAGLFDSIGQMPTPPAGQPEAASLRSAPKQPEMSEWPAAEAAKPGRKIRLMGMALRLNPVNVGVATGVLVVAMVLVIQLGRGPTPPSESADPLAAGQTGLVGVDAAMQQPPNPNVLAPATTSEGTLQGSGNTVAPAEGSTNSTTGGQRRAALNYVVIESFESGDRADVEHAQQWLQEAKGIPTTVRKSGERWLLVTAQGFDYRKSGEKQQAIEFCETAKALGKEYKQAFAGQREIRYLFRSPGIRKFTD